MANKFRFSMEFMDYSTLSAKPSEMTSIVCSTSGACIMIYDLTIGWIDKQDFPLQVTVITSKDY